MRLVTLPVAILALGMAGLLPRTAGAQEDAEPTLLPADAEAYEITQNFQYGCNPQRWAKVAGSESRIDNDPAPLVGRASVWLEKGALFLVLDQYNGDGSRHCVVLTRRGGPPVAGRYAVGRVSASLLEQTEPRPEGEPFYGTFALRDEAHASLLVVDSGFVEVTASGPGTITGTFMMAGFAIDGAERTDGVVRRGSFRAVTPAK